MTPGKHTLRVDGVVTSLSVDDAFWEGLQEIALSRGVTVTYLVNEINKDRSVPNLSSAVRVFVVEHFMGRSKGRVVSQTAPTDASGEREKKPRGR